MDSPRAELRWTPAGMESPRQLSLCSVLRGMLPAVLFCKEKDGGQDKPRSPGGEPATVTGTVAVAPPAVAEIVARPSRSAVTLPPASADATSPSDDDHVTVAPTYSLPMPSSTVTTSRAVSPGVLKVRDDGDTITDPARGGGSNVSLVSSVEDVVSEAPA